MRHPTIISESDFSGNENGNDHFDSDSSPPKTSK